MSLYKIIITNGGNNFQLRKVRSVYKDRVSAPFTVIYNTGLWSQYFYMNSGYYVSSSTQFLNFSGYTQDYTLAFWHKPSGLSGGELNRNIFNRYSTSPVGNAHGVYYSRATKNIRMYTGNTTSVTNSSSTVAENVWDHHVIRISGGTPDYYKNGIRVGFTTVATGIFAAPNIYTRIGADSTGANNALGHLHQTLVWNRALGYDEIYDLAHIGTISTTSLSGHYIDNSDDSNVTNQVASDYWYVESGAVLRSDSLPVLSGLMTINITTPTSSTITSPGSVLNIQWTHSGPNENIQIGLYENDLLHSVISSGYAAFSGSYSYTLNGSYTQDADYSIGITTVAGNHAVYSDYFIISNNEITVTSGVFTAYATSNLVHFFIHSSGLDSSAPSWKLERSLDGITYSGVNNPNNSIGTQGYYTSGTRYFLDADVSHGKTYHYKLSKYSPLVVTGTIQISIPYAQDNLWGAQTAYPNIYLSHSGSYIISGLRLTYKLRDYIDREWAFRGYLNQDLVGSREAYNSNVSGANVSGIDYLSYLSGTWYDPTWSGLTYADFITQCGTVYRLVSDGGIIHYLTNDSLVKNRALRAFTQFVSGFNLFSGQYLSSTDIGDFEETLGLALETGYDYFYPYMTQTQRDTAVKAIHVVGNYYRYTNDGNGFDLARLGDTHSNEDTGIYLRMYSTALKGTISDSSLRSEMQSKFDSALTAYSGFLNDLNNNFFSDGSGGASPFAGEYEFNEMERLMITVEAIRNTSGINFWNIFSGGLSQRSKYATHMTYPNGMSVNTGDNGYLFVDSKQHENIARAYNDSIARSEAFKQIGRIVPSGIGYGSAPQRTLSIFLTNTGVLQNTPYDLDWYSANKGMLISRSSWNSNATVFHVNAPKYQHFDKNSYDNGCFTLYYSGFQIPRAGLYGDGTDHDNNYRKKAYAANTIIIATGLLDNGDHDVRRAINTLDDFNTRDRRMGKTNYYRIVSGTHDISYICVDITPSFWSYKATNNYDTLDTKRAKDVTREFVFIKPNTLVMFDRVITLNSGYIQKNIIHFEQEPLISGLYQTVSGYTGISGGITLHSTYSGYTRPYEGGSVSFVVTQPSNLLIQKIGGVGFEYWNGATSTNMTPTSYNYSTYYRTIPRQTVEYGRGKWRLELYPSGYTTSGIYGVVWNTNTSGIYTIPNASGITNTNQNAHTICVRDKALCVTFSLSSFSGVSSSSYDTSGISGHLFPNLLSNATYEWTQKSLDGLTTYASGSHTISEADYAFRDLDEANKYNMGSGYLYFVSSGTQHSRFDLVLISQSSRTQTSLNSIYQSGLQLWLEGDSLNYEYNNAIMQWNDLSTNAYIASGSLIMPSALAIPNAYKGNYHGAARFGTFSGTLYSNRTVTSTGYLCIGHTANLGFSTSRGYSVFLVHHPRTATLAARQVLLHKGGYAASAAQRELTIEIKDSVHTVFVRNAGATQTLSSTIYSGIKDEMSLTTLIISGGTTGYNMSIYNNGYKIESENLAANLNTAGTQPILLGIGFDGTTYSNPYAGDIYAVLIYNSGLQQHQISGVWSYLASKYSIPMSGYIT